MQIPLQISTNDDIDLYLQIRYQLTYLITTHQLEAGTRLPSVRELANELKISKGSVSLAYRELQADGLLDSRVGLGTFVRAIDTVDTDSRALRHQRLTELLQDAASQAANLGFSAATIHQRLGVVLSRRLEPMRIVFVGATPAITERYGQHLRDHFRAQPLEIADLTFDEFLSNQSKARAVIDGVYFVVTFALQMAEVERALRRRNGFHEVIGFTTEATDDTLRKIEALSPTSRVVVVSQAQFLQGFVNVVKSKSRLPDGSVHSLLDIQEAELLRLLPDVDVVIHSSGIIDILDRLNVPEEKRLDMRFRITSNSLENLERTLFHDASSEKPETRVGVIQGYTRK